METVEGESFGEKYDLFVCLQCGKCTGSCPLSMRSQLNPRKLVREALLLENEAVMDKDFLWDCTTCATCRLRCPRDLQPVEVIIGMRSILIEEAKVPSTVQEALESTFKNGNPWGRAPSKREEWAAELSIKKASEGAEYLYYVGCTPAYDPRVQSVAKSLVRLFDAAGVDFAILGNEEKCCGNEIRRMGEIGLFEMLMEDNIEMFENYGVERIVTTSPHCYNVFKNEYEGLKAEVFHYTQLLCDKLDEGKLKLTKELKKKVIYQDPCFLGKQNKVFEEPRKLLSSIPGVELLEYDREKMRSVCCEGGGGRMWAEATATGERTAETRVKEAAALGAEVIAVACPFCLLTFEDAVKMTGYEGKIEVKDISELLIEAIEG